MVSAMAHRIARLFIVLLVLAMAVGAQVSTAYQVKAYGLSVPKASPDVACRGSDCTGDDPHIDGCDLTEQALDHKTVFDQYGNSIGVVYLEYSGSCSARWALTIANNGGARVSASIYGASGDNFSSIGVGIVHSLMVGAQLAKACGTVSGWKTCTLQK